ncbi:hypothetical protein BZA70DRAFT_269613 [Myxozyma melibiosi]|uniref:Putative transcription factor kapC n=1 Tax=Myxozyma melibiosi TaxID=54550 RepID=A0ABR1EZR0_9ASCO
MTNPAADSAATHCLLRSWSRKVLKHLSPRTADHTRPGEKTSVGTVALRVQAQTLIRGKGFRVGLLHNWPAFSSSSSSFSPTATSHPSSSSTRRFSASAPALPPLPSLSSLLRSANMEDRLIPSETDHLADGKALAAASASAAASTPAVASPLATPAPAQPISPSAHSAGSQSPSESVPPVGESSRHGRQLSTSKRAAQNRAAQRAFRQRKECYIKDLEAKFDELKASKAIIDGLRAENVQLRDYILALQSRLIEQPGVGGSGVPTPPAVYARRPIDFMHESNLHEQHNNAAVSLSDIGKDEQLSEKAR